MKIPNEVIPDCYKYAKQAFEGKITPVDARQKIHEELNINFGSARDYYLYYNYLVTGNKPTWVLNDYTLGYFLEHILKDYNNDIEQKRNTLIHFKKLIEKFEGDKVGSKKSMRTINEKYLKSL
ncbi:MAG: hypothetical protein CUR32_01310 [Flavobacterium sp.]|nr:MAG: hypothetical protein CUR32_01310 [Flavobacterium sp.] [Flavobacterium sp. FEMGT703F]